MHFFRTLTDLSRQKLLTALLRRMACLIGPETRNFVAQISASRQKLRGKHRPIDLARRFRQRKILRDRIARIGQMMIDCLERF